MSSDGTLTNQLLIAMPGMLDPNFSTTVTLICEHNDEGALGIVINRPTTLKLSGLFEQLSVEKPVIVMRAEGRTAEERDAILADLRSVLGPLGVA